MNKLGKPVWGHERIDCAFEDLHGAFERPDPMRVQAASQSETSKWHGECSPPMAGSSASVNFTRDSWANPQPNRFPSEPAQNPPKILINLHENLDSLSLPEISNVVYPHFSPSKF